MTRTRHTQALRHRTDAELNLIPLIDILSVMVAFLLLYSAEVEVVQNSKGLEIPQSRAELPPKQSVLLTITKDQLFVQGELIGDVAQIRTSRTRLFEPLRAVLERPLLVADSPAAGPELAEREITVLGDKALPFDVVKKVMETCTAAGYGRISLAVVEKQKAVARVGSGPA